MAMTADERNVLLASIRKEFGEQSMFILGQNERLMNVKVRSSGSLLLDLALGGGFGQGRLVGLSGPEKSGKTTIASLAIAEAQRVEPEKENAIIDLENTFNPVWASTLGVDVDRLFITQPETYAEKVYDMVEFLLKSGRFAYIIVDSVDGLVPKDEFEEGDWEKESRVGGASKLNAKAMRKLVNTGLLSHSGTTLVFIQQLRDKIGGFSPYGTPTTTSGGRSIKHNVSQMLEVSIGEYFSKGSGTSREVLGQQIKVKVSKNKLASPFKQAALDVYYAHGMDKVMELVNVSKELGVLDGTGWLKFIDPRTGEIFTGDDDKELKWQGKDKTRDALILDIEQNGGQLYTKMFDLVQDILRGE